MSAEAARRTDAMSLRDMVTLYLSLAGGFGRAVPLLAFRLPQETAQRLFSSFDEDYHISRFLHFSEVDGERFSINGIPATHVSIDSEIETIL